MSLQPKLAITLLLLGSLGCNLPRTTYPTQESVPFQFTLIETATVTPFLPPSRAPQDPILSPTPNQIRAVPTIRTEVTYHRVQVNDTLGQIAYAYGISIDAIIQANNLINPDVLTVGQEINIPAVQTGNSGPGFKIIPDSELVNGPANTTFMIENFVNSLGGYLSTYTEEVDGVLMPGWKIVQRIATFYSVNPRLLLAVLEYQSGWLTSSNPREDQLLLPIGYIDDYRTGLYRQLSWAANSLNMGYYLWRINAVGVWRTADGVLVPINPGINAGTAGLQQFFAQISNEARWRNSVSENGFFQTYNSLFGYPFDWAIEPLIPADLIQPTFQLPFENGVSWVFTGGPHDGWDLGSAWAALDFAPSSEQEGCALKDEWVVAVTDGLIVMSENGAVFQDLDGDGAEQTGWTVFYMHLDTRDRVAAGQFVKAGDRLGHPSCEGGFSTGSHLHIARKYNGEWISADGSLPFVMEGWTVVGDGVRYGGALVRADQRVEPCQCREPGHMVIR
ncbi:MAG: LysM peptidoglycan-binding domain-containing protein [Chloroflexota bacterium]